MNKKEEQNLLRRRQILEIALDHFIRYGFAGTSTRKIAEEAQISSGLMFHYFPDKTAIYEELVKIACEKMIVDTKSVTDPIAFFEKQIDWFYEILSADDVSSKIFIFMGLAAINASDISPTAAALLKAHDIESLSIPIIKKGQKAGVIRKGDPLALSVMFYGNLQQFAINMAVRPGLRLPPKESFMACLIVKGENS